MQVVTEALKKPVGIRSLIRQKPPEILVVTANVELTGRRAFSRSSG